MDMMDIELKIKEFDSNKKKIPNRMGQKISLSIGQICFRSNLFDYFGMIKNARSITIIDDHDISELFNIHSI